MRVELVLIAGINFLWLIFLRIRGKVDSHRTEHIKCIKYFDLYLL